MTVGMIVIVEVLTQRSLPVVNLGVILLAPAVYTVLVGGTRWGLLSMVIALAYYGYHYASLGGPVTGLSMKQTERFVATGLVAPVIVLSLGVLRARLEEVLVRERALRLRSEGERQRLSTLLARITDGFISIDREWRYTFVNARAEQLLGKRAMQLVGKTIWDAFPDLRGSELETEYRRAMREQVPVRFEFEYPPLATWFEIRAYPSGDGLSLFLGDVTAERGAREALATRLRQQAAVAALGEEALRARGLQPLLDAAVRRVAEGLDVEFVKVLELRPSSGALLLRVGIGWREGLVGHALVDAGEGSQAGYTLKVEAPVVADDSGGGDPLHRVEPPDGARGHERDQRGHPRRGRRALRGARRAHAGAALVQRGRRELHAECRQRLGRRHRARAGR